MIIIWNIKNPSLIAQRLSERRESIESIIDMYLTYLPYQQKYYPEDAQMDIVRINRLLSEYQPFVNGNTYFYTMEEI